MKLVNYLKGILYGFVVGWVVFVLIAALQLGAPTQTSHYIYQVDKIHLKFASSVKDPKLVIVSGSNSHFGISCQQLQEETKVPCLNAAKPNAGLGVEYILRRARLSINPGDTVLMPLEYELYLNDYIPEEGLVDYVFAHDPPYVLTHPQMFAFLSFPRLIMGLASRIKPANYSISYQEKYVSANGDYTNNKEATLTKDQRLQIETWQPMEIFFPGETVGVKAVRDFVKWCQKNNVRLLASWPNTIFYEAYKQDKYQEAFQNYQDFYRQMQVPVIGHPLDFMYDKSMFYDTIYHLNDRGVRQRTRQLIELLKPYLKRSS
ncbi:MAG: hypothetical protein KME26_29975 [Oscillatoria princeps RMCB-10]|jgi:hypothetical protein|nr:hypothetical protein [Oscillatoria princeps RMCB-10]